VYGARVISEASFFFTIAAISVTLAGFSGLVAAFRRKDQLSITDVFHLRTIAEVGLANALIALLTVPIATLSGDLSTAVRVGGTLVLASVLVQLPLFARRQRSMGVRVGRAHALGFIALDLMAIALAVVTFVTESVGTYEVLMVLLLARPMWDFVRVLRSLAGPQG
jgi:uncharacterized membrane protein YgdD (TMEM256/DUF423 family)